MGQVTLGLRSLAIKAAVFFIMAALLAWALGGTLFPRAEKAELASVGQSGRTWYWEIAVGGPHPGRVLYHLRSSVTEETPETIDDRSWLAIAGPLLLEDHLVYGGRLADRGWVIVDRSTSGTSEEYAYPDRLEVERQLARLRRGMSLQSPAEAALDREAILDPAGAGE